MFVWVIRLQPNYTERGGELSTENLAEIADLHKNLLHGRQSCLLETRRSYQINKGGTSDSTEFIVDKSSFLQWTNLTKSDHIPYINTNFV